MWRVVRFCSNDSPSSDPAASAIVRRLFLFRLVAYADRNYTGGFIRFDRVRLVLGNEAVKPYDIVGDLIEAGDLEQVVGGFQILNYSVRLSTLLKQREQGNARQLKWRKKNAERRRNAAHNAGRDAPTATTGSVSSSNEKSEQQPVDASPTALRRASPGDEPQSFRGNGVARKPPRKVFHPCG
jgi:hypothetical protein